MHVQPTDWPRFYRVAGASALLTAATTLPIHLLSFPSETLDEQVALRGHPVYLARFAVIVLHVVLVVVSMLGVAIRRRTACLPLAALGFLGYCLFALGELLRTALAYYALNASWRAAYANAADPEARAAAKTLLLAWPGINDALFHLFLFGFIAGTGCYAAMLVRGRGLERATGAVFAVWAFTSAVGWFVGLPDWISVTLQPLGRVLVGIWLFRHAATPHAPPA